MGRRGRRAPDPTVPPGFCPWMISTPFSGSPLVRPPGFEAARPDGASMAHFEKHFTLEEANALLPELRELLAQLQEGRDQLTVHWEAARPVIEATRTNGGG